MTKTMGNSKKYGSPYSRKHLLTRGKRMDIANETGYDYNHVCAMLGGVRTLQLSVKTLADKYADEQQLFIDSLKAN